MNFYKDFVTELKGINPSQYEKMAKRIGAVDKKSQGDINIERLDGLAPEEQVEKIAESFAAISNEYEYIKLEELPAFLPAEESPQISVYNVYKKIQNQKKTKSTLLLDIPEKLRKDAAEFLAEPLLNIFITCLKEGTYPKMWKKRICNSSA